MQERKVGRACDAGIDLVVGMKEFQGATCILSDDVGEVKKRVGYARRAGSRQKGS